MLWLSASIIFCATAVVSIATTVLVRQLALRWQLVDRPDGGRKQHAAPAPLAGGVAVWFSFTVVVLITAFTTGGVFGYSISLKQLLALLLGGLVLVVGGVADDRRSQPWQRQLLGPLLAIVIVIAGGIGVDKITNPLGGVLSLHWRDIVLFWWHGVAYKLTLWSDLFTVIWLLAMMLSAKLLDGLDGLVAGVGTIGSLAVFFLSTATRWYQPDTALLAIALAGACAGFLVLNFHPAKIFLGESGPLVIGFTLGVLSIIAGGKIATTLLVMGLPMLDVAWVMARRLLWERKNPFTSPDRKHLHFRLLTAGFSHRGAVLFLYALTAAFGSLTLVLQSQGKLVALGVLVVVMVGVGAWLVIAGQRRQKE